MTYKQTFDRVVRHAREIALWESSASVLGWDERTKMPSAATEYRAEQLSLLAGTIHSRRVDAEYGAWLAELAESPLAADRTSDTGATIRHLKRDYDKQVKLPQTLVEELVRTASLAQHIWQQARERSDFSAFRDVLGKMFELKRAQAEAIGYKHTPYDALLDDYEPDESTAAVERVLAELRDALVPLVAAIASSGRRADASILSRHFARDAQENFGQRAAAEIGFDFGRGRLDVTAHPFCSSLGPDDCRITTRFDEQFFNSAFFGILHEAGHGIYDQGLRTDWHGLPPGAAISLGIHESQSRMWENLVGRSLPFWQHFYPQARTVFPSLADVPLEDFYFAVNHVQPSLIRVEADEATYNLHILIRFELEQALVADELRIDDLPAAWNAKYHDYLGITPSDDADGVLQDIHWAAGLVGYFPTYSLGNLYASQFFAAADAELGGLGQQFAAGQFGPLKEWLVEHIHSVGQCFTAAELVERVTGKPLSHRPLIAHLRGKLAPLYGL
ncbi:MAG TPA: carboxypeptidase M32 [Pirellulales bacterium]|nr:carboxypeptidase M32 [Pirellulales bacterium]